MNHWIDVETPDGSFKAYVALPSAASAPRSAPRSAPSVVVLQEIFGVNADLRQTCDELAAKGYIALSPDLFWRMKPGLDITDQTEAEWKQGFDFYTAFDIEKGIADIGATIRAARALEGASGKIGLMGYCLGGLLTLITASRTHVDAAVAYYGGNSELHLSEVKTLASPLMFHVGENDEYISQAAQRSIQSALADRADVQMFIYPGAKHAFARHQGVNFNADAAALANRRTDEFFVARLT